MNLEELMKIKYDTSIKYIDDGEDSCYKVSIDLLPGLSVYVDTIEEGLEELEGAKQAWFSAALELGRNIPIPENTVREYSGRFSVRVGKSLHKDVSEFAEKDGISLNQAIISLLQKGLKEECLSQIYNSLESMKKEKSTSEFHFHIKSNKIDNKEKKATESFIYNDAIYESIASNMTKEQSSKTVSGVIKNWI